MNAPRSLALLLPDQQTLKSHRPEDFARAFAVASVCGAVYPHPQTVRWIATMTPPFDGTDAYWSPYARAGSAVYVRSWARGAYGYESRHLGAARIELLDPIVWYEGIMAKLDGLQAHEDIWVACDLAREMTDPVGPYSDSVIDLWTAVRNAQQKGELLTDPRKIKAACKRAGVLPS